MFKVPRLSILTVAALSLALCATAQAQITLGQLAPGTNPFPYCSGGPIDSFQIILTSVPTPEASYVVPAPGGVLTSWSTNAGPGIGQTLKMKVFRQISGSDYLVVAHDGPRGLTPGVINTFPVSIPVRAGEVIGFNDQNASAVSNACIFAAAPGDIYGEGFSLGDPADGASEVMVHGSTGFKLNISATLLPPPTIASISPTSGSIKGGKSVVISGSNFAEVKSVSFGAAAASTYTLDSESKMTAVLPARKSLGRVPVSVTTIAGTATSTQTFAYEGCVVPRLKGKRLRAAKKTLAKAQCRLGKVRGVNDKTARVVKQSPKPGKVLPIGSGVNVKVG